MRFNFYALSCIIFHIYISIMPDVYLFCKKYVSKILFVFIFSCFAPKVPPDVNFNALTCSPNVPSPAIEISASSLAIADENLSLPSKFLFVTYVLFLIHLPNISLSFAVLCHLASLLSACIQKGKNKVLLPKEHNLASTKVSHHDR